ncbi:hypothetical protein M409DRAFT_18716 [Zasmidium cellare ATCC 36951]|uniref:Uncharacterized protein n=1 Tax=Zasmidium cellare ATCC 36951 TaxID=1080233 RepID=A0A6A6CUB1_ZASCE|nr:uncharacterized protein M409DRAFT_18716 [Zasmidium cellare ATCC 36951]KAF2170744.1 hypothetical protein M409DRAFT_18716 [Zasmidium cellare ATCC 36951]
MAPARGAMCSRQAQLGQSKPKAKQTDSKSNSLQAQSARSHQPKFQRRRERINRAAEQDASRAARQNADRGAAHRARRQNRARQEDNGAPKTLLHALEKTLRGLGFTDTEVTLFRRQVAARQLPDLTSLSFTELTSLVVDSKIESSSEMLCRALTELQRHLTELTSRITSLRPSETYELFWMVHGVKPFDPTKINADRAIDLIEAGILGQEAPQLQEDLKPVVISAAHSAKQSRPRLSDIFDKIIARYLPPNPTG